MTENNEKPTKQDRVVEQLCKILSQNNLTTKQISELLPRFLFSVGASLENCNLHTNEEVLMRYAEKPTFGNALMAQALWMKETWAIPQDERETKND